MVLKKQENHRNSQNVNDNINGGIKVEKRLTNDELVKIIMNLPVGSYIKDKRIEMLAKAVLVNHIAYIYLGENNFEDIISKIIGFKSGDQFYTRYEACSLLGVDINYLDNKTTDGLGQAEEIVNDYFSQSGIFQELYKRFIEKREKVKTK